MNGGIDDDDSEDPFQTDSSSFMSSLVLVDSPIIGIFFCGWCCDVLRCFIGCVAKVVELSSDLTLLGGRPEG